MPVSDSLTRMRSERVESLLESIRVRAFGLRQRFEPVGNFREPFFARLLRHARIHVTVFVRLTGNCGFEIVLRLANRQPRRRIAYCLEIFEMTMRMAGLAFRGRTENCRHIVVSL